MCGQNYTHGNDGIRIRIKWTTGPEQILKALVIVTVGKFQNFLSHIFPKANWH